MAQASSNFDGSENPLSEGGMWATPGGGDAVAMQKISGEARGTLSVTLNMAYLVTPSIGPDQFSEIEVASATPAYPAACVRMNSADTDCYMLECNDDGQGVIEIIYVDPAGGLNVLGAAISTAMDALDKFKLTVVDTTLTAYRNGVALGTRTDSNRASGQPGIRTESADAVDGITSWSGGDLVPAPVPADYSQFPKYKLRTTT